MLEKLYLQFKTTFPFDYGIFKTSFTGSLFTWLSRKLPLNKTSCFTCILVLRASTLAGAYNHKTYKTQLLA